MCQICYCTLNNQYFLRKKSLGLKCSLDQICWSKQIRPNSTVGIRWNQANLKIAKMSFGLFDVDSCRCQMLLYWLIVYFACSADIKQGSCKRSQKPLIGQRLQDLDQDEIKELWQQSGMPTGLSLLLTFCRLHKALPIYFSWRLLQFQPSLVESSRGSHQTSNGESQGI